MLQRQDKTTFNSSPSTSLNPRQRVEMNQHRLERANKDAAPASTQAYGQEQPQTVRPITGPSVRRSEAGEGRTRSHSEVTHEPGDYRMAHSRAGFDRPPHRILRHGSREVDIDGYSRHETRDKAGRSPVELLDRWLIQWLACSQGQQVVSRLVWSVMLKLNA